jgi:hypothetical protein
LAGVATGDEIADQSLGRAIGKPRAIGGANVPAGSDENGVPGRNVPIVRRRQARIKVCGAFGYSAKFD